METAANCLAAAAPYLRRVVLRPQKKSKIVIDMISELCDKPHFN
jgi:hypothetical protein